MVRKSKFQKSGWFGSEKIVGHGDTPERAWLDCVQRIELAIKRAQRTAQAEQITHRIFNSQEWKAAQAV
ncbi:MAG: hypothetical protein ACRBBW_12985 [Cellvibrionaceae bacterium]